MWRLGFGQGWSPQSNRNASFPHSPQKEVPGWNAGPYNVDLTLGQLVWRVIRAGWGPRLRVSVEGQRKYDYFIPY